MWSNACCNSWNSFVALPLSLSFFSNRSGCQTYIPQFSSVTYLSISTFPFNDVVFLLLIPGCVCKPVMHNLLELFLQGAIVTDSPLTLLSYLLADRFGGLFPIQEPGPAIVRAMQLGRDRFAGAVGLAAFTGCCGDRSWQDRSFGDDGNFCFYS